MRAAQSNREATVKSADDYAREIAEAISDTMDAPLRDEQIARIRTLVAAAMESAVTRAGAAYANACTTCLSHDEDLAHKLRREIKRKTIGLIANLSGMR